MAYTPPTHDSIIRKEIRRSIEVAIPGEKIYVANDKHKKFADELVNKLRPGERIKVETIDLGKETSLWNRW